MTGVRFHTRTTVLEREMRSLVNITTTAVAAVSVFLLSGLRGEAQEATTIQQSSELKVLQQFIGSWEQQVAETCASVLQ